MPLAVTSYEKLAALADSEDLLNLAWTLDERAYLSTDLQALVSQELCAEVTSDEPYIDRYLVQDPYGEHELRGALASFFDTNFESLSITCGAGVISLLHGLAQLTVGRPAYIIGDIYPDFPVWVEQLGGRLLSQASAPKEASHVEGIRNAGASVVLLERPSLIDDRFVELQELQALCAALASQKVVVVVDESYANYYPPDFSAVQLLSETNNLVVIRGLSKAYWLGGLRLSYCVTTNALRDTVRSVIPPLLTASISLRVGRRIIELGDITQRLRERIDVAKNEAQGILESAGVGRAMPASKYLPYIFFAESDRDAPKRLEHAGVLGKSHLIWAEATCCSARLYRISTPLSKARMTRLRDCLAIR